MSDQPSNRDDLISFIAARVETMGDRVETIQEQMATVQEQMATVQEQMATKEELASVRKEIAYAGGQVESLRDQVSIVKGQMATNDGLARLETTMQGDFEQVHIRFDALDHTLSSRMGSIETELSRLRSVVYLLAKDKPDMLRLLGRQTPDPEGRS
jgi:chaperonin cofactor prefoldin